MQEGHISQPEDRNEVLELWKWAGVAANELARGHEWGGEFTKEERELGVENVVTGLKRGLEEDYENDSEEDEEAPDGNEMGIIGVKRKDGGGTEFQVRKVVDISASGEASDALPLENILKFMITGAEPLK